MATIKSFTPEQQESIRMSIRWYMKAQGLSTEDLAKKMRLSRQTVRNYLASAGLSELTIIRFAKALDCQPEDLYSGNSFTTDVIFKMKSQLDELEKLDIRERLRLLEEAVFGKALTK